MFPEGLKYIKNHSWIKVEGNKGKIGLTNFAQEQLSDIVTVELPAAGKAVTAMNPFGTIESVKATMDLITPVSGEVNEVNAGLTDAPEKVNQDPYGEGWMIVVTMSNRAELSSLLSAANKCHTATTTKKGPSFASIATKYKSDAAAAGKLAEMLKTGGMDHDKVPASDADLKAAIAVVLSSK